VTTDDHDQPGAIERLFQAYLSNVRAHAEGAGTVETEAAMRMIERRAGIGEGTKDAFRAEVLNIVAALAIEGKTFDHRMHERLHRALALEVLEG